MQEDLDALYQQSRNGDRFYKLVELMSKDENIRLAYRNIKRNMGSLTAGVDGKTIQDIQQLTIEEVMEHIRAMFQWYKPQKVRRTFIPKPDGSRRPLGIPTIWDRLFQQCILQVLEPVCEAKFHGHSYGFRPHRNTHHALARMKSLVNSQGKGFHYCIDMDIQGFFDHVHHGKLLKQLWSMDIRDKTLIAILSSLLKAEVQGEGIPSQGTPQGGILSPLLSNIALNELDWWISDQWETIETSYPYAGRSEKYKALKKTNLKECFLVRYADDFKIMCRDYPTAVKMFYATQDFLQTRLKLDIHPEKSFIVNLQKHASTFLGFSIKARKKRNRHVAHSRMTAKARKQAYQKLTMAVKAMARKQTPQAAWQYNTTVMGIQNYYSAATHINRDLDHLSNHLTRMLYNRLRRDWKRASKRELPHRLQQRYRRYHPKWYKLQGIVLLPIYTTKHQSARNFTPAISSYTKQGRALIHDSLQAVPVEVLRHVQRFYIPHRTIEYNDNRITTFIAQYGRCAMTGLSLGLTGWHCHHKVPLGQGGTDRFDNLVIIQEDIHQALHQGDIKQARTTLGHYTLNNRKKQQFDDWRILAGHQPIFRSTK